MEATITTRQAHTDALLAMVSLAGEVEELTYDAPELVVERLRARIKASGVTQVGTPGAPGTFDPAMHDAMGERPADGAPVIILRPGYTVAGALLAPALVVAA